jgi:autotransporter translocation and assembly factor TamB
VLANADSFALWRHPVRLAGVAAHARGDSVTLFATAADAAHEKLTASATLRGVTARTGAERVRGGDAAATGAVLRLDELRIGGGSPWRLAGPAQLAFGGGTLRVDTIDMRHTTGARLAAGGRLAWANGASAPSSATATLDFGVSLDGVPFAEVLRGLRSRADGAGAVNGTLRIRGDPLDPVIEGELDARDVRYGDVRIDRAFAELTYAALGLDAHAEMQHGGRSILTGGGRVPLDLRLTGSRQRRLDEPLRFTIVADSLPPALPLGLLDGFSNVGGRIDGTVVLAGTTAEPSMSGGLGITGGAADWEVSGVRYSDVSGTFALERGRTLRLDLRAFAGDARARGVRTLTGGSTGGSGSVTGTLDFTALTDPRFDLRFRTERAYAARRRDVEASVTGEVTLGGSYTRPLISGALRVDEGALYIDELYRRFLIVGLELDDPRLLSLVDTSLVAVRPLLATSLNPFLRGMQVRGMQVTVGSDSWLRSRDMDVEVSGGLAVAFDRRDEDLRLSGSLNVERGTYTLYYPPLQSRRFKVTGGSIDFVGTPGIDPNLAITAAYRARAQGEPLDILAGVSGTLQNPRVRLSSDTQPPISESDLASYLFFGVPTSQVANSGAATGDVRAVAGLGARALGPSVLGYASSGLQTLVQGAGLLDYVSLSAAEVGAGSAAAGGLTGVFAGTQLELGRYIGSRLFLGYTQRLGGASYDPAARLEWRFLPEYTFELFAEDRLARTPGFGIRPDAGLRKVYGFSLFREWGF